jgi:hypothetical protein
MMDSGSKKNSYRQEWVKIADGAEKLISGPSITSDVPNFEPSSPNSRRLLDISQLTTNSALDAIQ